jgi:hypothetical protein
MPIELGGIKISRIHKIATLEDAAFVYHRIPGQEGNTVQNLGRDSVRLQIEGIFYGPKAKEDLEKLRNLHIKRQPVDFIADVLGQAYTGKVTLDRFEVSESALEPQQFSYILVVSEYVQPPASASSVAAVDSQIKVDAQAGLNMAALPDALALGSLPEITNPFPPLKDALEPAKQASSGLLQSVGGMKKLFGIDL